MSSLNASLAIALSGLTAEQAALEATANNVANANTPGYCREVPVLVASDPVIMDPLTLGTGVNLRSIESMRDPILESRIQQETQTQGQLGAMVAAMAQAQVSFTSNSGDVGTALSNFFNSFNQLATDPADLSLRQGVLTAAGNLATAFNVTANQLATQRSNLDSSLEQAVGQINQLTGQIAQLNGQISSLEDVGENAGTFVDQRTQLIDKLSSLIDVSVIASNNTLTLTTAAGAALVSGQQSFQFSTQPDKAGVKHIYAAASDITGSIVAGQLGGVLKARDDLIPGMQKQLDTLAFGFAEQVNSVQTGGYDLNGKATTGVSLFSPLTSSTDAAENISLAISDTSLIAASSDGTAGDNANAEAMYALRNQGFIDGESPIGFYSNIVFGVGNTAAQVNAEQSASNLILGQLNDQRSSVSGVSLDEEAANMMRYQQAYAASAQVIAAINSMMQTVIAMKTS